LRRRRFAAWGQLRNRLLIRRELRSAPPDRVYVGVDAPPEMQYAMHLAKQLRADARCIYVEDGSAAYVVALRRPPPPLATARRALRRWSRRVLLGSWWQKVDGPGTSSWIDEAVVAFPDLVVDRLRHLPCRLLPSVQFAGPELLDLAQRFGTGFGVDRDALQRADVLVALASSTTIARNPARAAAMTSLVRELTAAGLSVLVKHHPRERDPGYVRIAAGPRLYVAPAAVPFELLLLLGRPQVAVVGDISTALISTRWLLPRARILALRQAGGAAGINRAGDTARYLQIFQQLGIDVLDDPREIARRVTATGS
jgi:Alpha-2,8-polysialyltransferase (POLYST)